MTLTIGQRVRIISVCKWHNQVGIIQETTAGQFHVAGPDFGPYWFWASELEAVREEDE